MLFVCLFVFWGGLLADLFDQCLRRLPVAALEAHLRAACILESSARSSTAQVKPMALFDDEDDGQEWRGRVDAEAGEPKFHWLGQAEADDMTGKALWALGREEGLRLLAQNGITKPFLAVDAHGTLEVDDALNETCVAFLQRLERRWGDQMSLLVLSWVGLANMEKIGLRIRALLQGAGAALADMPVLLCTGNRIGKAALCGFGSRCFGRTCHLLDDSSRNLRASYAEDNLVRSAERWGIGPLAHVRFWFYYDTAQHGKYRGRALPDRQRARRLAKAVEQWQDVAHELSDGDAARMMRETAVVVDRRSEYEDWHAPPPRLLALDDEDCWDAIFDPSNSAT